jgi:riboflavin kinase/FMN adenylyltransferase
MASPGSLAALVPFPIDAVPAGLTGGVVTIGNFDGVHRGHQTLIAATKAEAERRGVPALVLSFEPHPRTVLRPELPVFRLTPEKAKARVLMALGVDGFVLGTFDRDFASQTPDEFVQSVLVKRLRISGAVVGFDFRYGKMRGGNGASLADAGRRLGFSVSVIDAVPDASGTVIASRDIRAALGAGDVVSANVLLGYRWFVTGIVEHGEARGRGLGFPTANVRLDKDCGLRHGIYAVRLTRPGGRTHGGVASFGIRPTFGGGAPLLEVFVFDFNESLYGEEVAVTVHDWIRPEEKFSSVADLVAAIGRDVAAARAILAAAGPGTSLDRAIAALP